MYRQEPAEIEPLRDEMPPLPREIFLCLDLEPLAIAQILPLFMSTLASAALSSDDEGDADFQLPEPKSKGKSRKRARSNSASGSSSSDSDDELDTIDTTEAQKLKAEQEAAESEERKKRAAAAFEAMKSGSTAAVNKPSTSTAGSAMVEVQRARNFAGETIT